MGILKLIHLLETRRAIPVSIEAYYTFIGGSLNVGTYLSAGK
jgi:hypothetical protein